MANGYIGKISAVVTANTSDLSRKLSGAVGDVDKFANGLEVSLRRIEKTGTQSFERLFTPLQNLERKFATALKFNIRTEEQVTKLRQLTSVAEQVNKPLSTAVSSFSKLSLEIQGAFLPALDRAQTAAVNLSTTLDQQGSVSERSFGQVKQIVDQTTASIKRLAQAQQLASQSFTGNELQFANPRLFETLSRGATLTQRAAALPANALDNGDIARQVQLLQQYQNAAVEADARVSALRLTPDVDPEVILAAERRLSALTETAQRAQRQLATTIAGTSRGLANAQQTSEQRGLGLFGTRVGTEAEQAIARARAASAAFEKLPEASRAGLIGLAGIASNVANAVQAGTSSANALNEVLDVLVPRIERLNAAPPQSTSLIVRPPDANVQIAATRGSLVDGFNQRRAQTSADIAQRLGRGLDDPLRAIGGVETQIVGLKASLDSLPASIRSRFIPAIQDAEGEFERLSLSPSRTIADIEQLSQRVSALRGAAASAAAAMDFRSSFGTTNAIASESQRRQLQAYASQIRILQDELSRVAVEARGPAAAAIAALGTVIANAMEGGTLETQRSREAIESLSAEAVRATANVRGISASTLQRTFSRAGDIGRAGFGNVGLALQQAAFAVEDFFSVTGDLDQRIRAAGNNLSQLGFILGSTTGLFVGIGIAIAGQAVAALVKWINNGQKSEDTTKALNDSLARQKSLVESLAESFGSLADELARITFSEQAQQARSFQQELDAIAKKQRETRQERAASLDPDVIAARARRNQIDRELGETTDPGVAARLLRDRQDAVRRERAAIASANRPVGDGGDVRSLVERAIRRELLRDPFVSGAPRDPETNRRIEEARRRAAEQVTLGGDVDARAAQRRAVEQRIEELRPNVRPRNFFLENVPFSPRANAEADRRLFAELEQTLARLDNELLAALDDLSIQISRSSRAAAIEIEGAQRDVADAIRRGVRGASDFQAALDNTARQLQEAQDQLRAARENESLTPGDRETAVRRAEDRVRDVGLRLDAINERAREVRLGRGFGGERTTAALSALSGERFINEEAGLRARLRAAIDAEEQARRAVEAAIQRGDEAARDRATKDLEAAQAASDLAAAAAEAAVAIEQAFSRLRKAAENIVSQSEQLADNAQSALDTQDPRAPGAVNRDELTRERDEAERQLIQDRRRQRELQNRLDRERAEAANDPRVAVLDRRLEQLRSEREDAAANARLNGVQEDPRAAERRENEIARLEAEREEAVRQQTAETRRLIDQENQLIATRRRAAEEIQRQREFEAEVARRRNPQGDAVRGLDLLETPGERAARELAQNLADINEAVDREVERILGRAGGRPQDAEQELADLGARAEDARRRAREDILRGVAPAIFSLADEVQNSILQGPSRAALGATDASTVEGQRELNRLLRGDDSNRDVDLAELQRQSNRLLETIADNTGKENQVAN